MKLELKHLAAYLPYNLECKVEGYSNPLPMVSVYNDSQNGFGKFGAALQEKTGNDFGFDSGELNPILRPLSDLFKKISIDNIFFIPIIELAELEFTEHREVKIFDNKVMVIAYEDAATFEFSFNEKTLNFTYTNSVRNGNVCFYNYKLIEKLKEWHFDIFGLIKAGLAIDINKQ